MKLSELSPKWIRYETHIEKWNRCLGDQNTWHERGCPTEEVEGPREHILFVPAFSEAQGIWFDCPRCRDHSIHVSFDGRGLKDYQGSHNKAGKATRWATTGADFSTLSMTPSIQLEGGCNWHGYITNGEAK